MFSRSLIKSTLKASRAFTPATMAASRGFHSSQAAFAISVSDASSLPSDYNEMNNDLIQIMAVDGDMKAKEERLRRNIMKVDQVEWDAANNKFLEIKNANRSGAMILKLPYYSGLFLACTTAFASVPLCFDLSSVMQFNEAFVTQPVPEAEDLEVRVVYDPSHITKLAASFRSNPTCTTPLYDTANR
jgi:hypothetical protein